MKTNLKTDTTVADICDPSGNISWRGRSRSPLPRDRWGAFHLVSCQVRKYRTTEVRYKTKAHRENKSRCAPVFGELTKTHCAHSAWSHCRQFIALLGSSSHLAKIWPNEISSASHMVMIPHFGHKINPCALPQRGRDTTAKTP